MTADADRCPVCDLPRATAEQWCDHASGCECAECAASCWDTGAAMCAALSVNWRERALAAEARERDAAHRERAAVVAYIEREADAMTRGPIQGGLYAVADEIADGKHEKEEP